MRRHLQEEDLCRWIAGDRSHEAEQHLESCAQCRSHIARMSEVLGGFHTSVRDRGQRRLAEYGPFPPGAARVAIRAGLGWGRLPVAALVTLFVALAAWLPWQASRSSRLAEGPEASVHAADDAALLRRVDAEVSRAVPIPMEPLAALIKWQPEPQPGTQGPADR